MSDRTERLARLEESARDLKYSNEMSRFLDLVWALVHEVGMLGRELDSLKRTLNERTEHLV